MKNVLKFAIVLAALVVASAFLNKEKISDEPQIAAPIPLLLRGPRMAGPSASGASGSAARASAHLLISSTLRFT